MPELAWNAEPVASWKGGALNDLAHIRALEFPSQPTTSCLTFELCLFNLHVHPFHLFIPCVLFSWATLLPLLPYLIAFVFNINRKEKQVRGEQHPLSDWLAEILTFRSCSLFFFWAVCLECWEALYVIERDTDPHIQTVSEKCRYVLGVIAYQ